MLPARAPGAQGPRQNGVDAIAGTSPVPSMSKRFAIGAGATPVGAVPDRVVLPVSAFLYDMLPAAPYTSACLLYCVCYNSCADRKIL
jgi:hypothetical protein